MRDLVATALLCVAAVEATTPVQIISGSGELLSSASSSVATDDGLIFRLRPPPPPPPEAESGPADGAVVADTVARLPWLWTADLECFA